MQYTKSSSQHVSAQRLAALSRIGSALMREWDETHLFQLIVETARDLIGASFVALTLRPVSDEGEPLVPSEGHLFHLAAIAGVSPEQEAKLRRMPLGGEGLLLPIFHHGVPVRVADVVALVARTGQTPLADPQAAARQAANAFVQGQLTAEELHAHGIPPGHPIVRSFLGAPVLNPAGEVRGGLLLGHSQPDQFTYEDEIVLAGLAAQATVALEHIRWCQTAQMRAQELDALFESIAGGVTLVDPQGNVLRENGTARQLRARLLETPEGERSVEVLLATPSRRVLAGKAVHESTVRVDVTGGEMHEYLVTASPLRLPTSPAGSLPQDLEPMGQAQGTMAGAVVVWRDVTEVRRWLVETEAEQFKDEFISIAAHELRTPLAILTGFVQTLLSQTARGKGPQLSEWQKKSLQGIDLATSRLIDLAEDLLDVTRVQAGRLELQREPANLVALAQRVLARQQLTTERHTLTLITELPHLVIHADPRRMEQVLSNLIGNAIKYSPEGGAIEVTICVDNETHEVLLSVRDQGIGIPLHEQAQVFGRFARADNAQAYGIRGTGLGLYLCRELVEQHGGRIWLESTEGLGSTFFVTLPLTSQDASMNLVLDDGKQSLI